MSSAKDAALEADRRKPWWKFPIVWLVVGGPLTVVIASLFTVGIAIKNVDPVLDTSAPVARTSNEAPAMQGRNHAAEAATHEAADR